MSIFLIPLAGFLGSFHCAAMCGPFMGYCSAGNRAPLWQVTAAYQAGRLAAYLALGTLAGLLGQGILFAGEVVEAQRIVLIALGCLMIGAGLWHYLPRKWRGPQRPNGLFGTITRVTGKLEGVEGAALIGLFSALLPCGYLYGFVTVALAAGTPLLGMATMAAFWLGTLPALLGASAMVRLCSRTLLFKLQRLTPAVLVLLGLIAVLTKGGLFPGMQSGAHCFDP